MTGEKRTGFILLLLVATVFMGSSFPTGKYLISVEGVPPFFLGGWRFLAAGLLVLAAWAVRYGPETVVPLSRGSILTGFVAVFFVGLFQTAGAMGFLNLSLGRIDSSLASVLFFTSPLWVLVFAHYTKTESVTRRRIAGLILGVIGVCFCLGIDGSAESVGAAFAVTGALCWAVCTILTARYIRFGRSPFVLAGWQMVFGGLVLLAVSLAVGERFALTDLSGSGWFNALWLVLPASVGSFSLWFLALQKGGAARTSSFLFLTPMFASVLSIVFLGETMTKGLWIGGAMIFASIYIVNTRGGPLPPRWFRSNRVEASTGITRTEDSGH